MADTRVDGWAWAAQKFQEVADMTTKNPRFFGKMWAAREERYRAWQAKYEKERQVKREKFPLAKLRFVEMMAGFAEDKYDVMSANKADYIDGDVSGPSKESPSKKRSVESPEQTSK